MSVLHVLKGGYIEYSEYLENKWRKPKIIRDIRNPDEKDNWGVSFHVDEILID